MKKVQIVATTQPVKRLQNLGVKTAEDLIVYCARVSNPQNQLNVETGDKLLRYCIKHGHWSVFEQADITVEIKTSRAIAAQILRHSTASFQEFSQRYAEIQEFEPIELRAQGKTNRQVGNEIINPFFYGDEVLSEEEAQNLPGSVSATDLINNFLDTAKDLYSDLIRAGVARECARMILPMTTQTTMYMKNNVRNWMFYANLRGREDTQKEHRELAEEIKDILYEEFPLVSKAFFEYRNSD